MRGDVGREARESLGGQRHERLPMALLVRREAAGRGDLAQVRVVGVGRDRGASTPLTLVFFRLRGVFERATDGSWSSSKVRDRYGKYFVAESVLLG